MFNKTLSFTLIIVLLLVGCSVEEDGKTLEDSPLALVTSQLETDELDWVIVDQDLDELKELQKQVDEGHRPGLMDPIQVATQFAYDYLDHIFDHNEETNQIIDNDNQNRSKIVTYRFKNNCKLEIRLNHPVGSVWAVESFRLSGDCEQSSKELGSDANIDIAPVTEHDKNNPEFENNLNIFPSLVSDNIFLTELTPEQVFDWVCQVEEIYQKGMTSQLTFTQEQRDIIEKWLESYLSDEMIKERVGRAMKSVEGGYRINYAYDVYDFNIYHIEKVVMLDMKYESDTTTLTADLIVLQEWPVRVTYEITTKDNVSKLTGYKFEELEKTK